LRSSSLGLAALLLAGPAAADGFGIGTPASPAMIAPWNIDVRGDGAGLPAGEGDVGQGEALYARECAACHGKDGIHGALSADLRLAGGIGTLASTDPVRTVGSYWPYAPTLFDYIRRAMPFTAPESLTADQVYAVTAYVLFLNGLVPHDAVLDAKALAAVRMPNRDGFRPVDPAAR
jgi:mono/diheme cytochrome c family protein